MWVIFEALNASVDYDAASQKTAVKSGHAINLDTVVTIRNDSTIVLLRFVAKALQVSVNWDNSS